MKDEERWEQIVEVTGVVRIGYGGKLHPAIKTTYKNTENGRLSSTIEMLCHCPNSQNGFGNNAATFYSNFSKTCKG